MPRLLLVAVGCVALAVPVTALGAGGKVLACEGAAGSFSCMASYESLPRGTYTWRISWVGITKMPAHVELTVRW